MRNKKLRNPTLSYKLPNLDDLPQLVTIPEIALVLRMNGEVVRRHLHSGKFPGTRVGGQWRMRIEDLRALVNPFPVDSQPATQNGSTGFPQPPETAQVA